MANLACRPAKTKSRTGRETRSNRDQREPLTELDAALVRVAMDEMLPLLKVDSPRPVIAPAFFLLALEHRSLNSFSLLTSIPMP